MKKLFFLLTAGLILITELDAQTLYIPESVGSSTNNYVGIGTNTPVGILHIHNQSYGTGRITLSTGAANAETYSIGQGIMGTSNGGFSIIDVTNNQTRLAIQYSTGNIGIGTNTPTSHTPAKALIISGYDSGLRGLLELWDESGGKALIESVGGNTYLGSLAKGSGSGSSYITYGNGTVGITLEGSNGNVGIGTTAPSQKLEIVGNIKLTNYAYQEFNLGNTRGYIWGNHNYSGTAGMFQDDLVLSANWQGVDSNTDNIINSSSFLRNAAISLGRHGIRFFSSNNSTTAPSEKVTINGEGLVGIGTTTPNSKLDINSQGLIPIRVINDDFVQWVFKKSRSDDSQVLGIKETSMGTMSLLTNNTERLTILQSGNIGIGILDPGSYKLNVSGSIRANEVVVTSGGADFVFAPDYKLLTLPEVESFIKANKHLPDLASATEMKENGMNVSEMQTKLLQKIEELTIYAIEQNKMISQQNKKIRILEDRLEKMESTPKIK